MQRSNDAATPESSERHRRRWLLWLFGIAGVATLVVVIVESSNVVSFARIVSHVRVFRTPARGTS